MKPILEHIKSVIFLLTLFLIPAFTTLAIAAETGAPANGNENSAIGNGTNERFVSIDFNDVEIEVFIKFISELTNKNFIIDRRVKGKVSIISPSKISVEEAYKVFESVLEVNGFATVTSGEIIKIVPSPEVRTKNIVTKLRAEAGSDDRVVTQLIPLRYADPEEIKKLFTPLISKNSVLLSYKPTNMLILTDVHSNIQRLLEILKVIDITDTGRQLTVLPIVHADAVKLVSLLENVFETRQRPTARGAAPLEKAVNMVADERTNTIVLMASEAETARIRDLIALIDKEAPKGSERIRVYYLEHAKAEDLATVLQSLSTKTQAPAPAGAAAAKEPIVSGKVNITADKPTNSLIIMAEKDEYMIIEDVIKQLDIPRPMVFIECLIMEVNVNKDMNMGVEWFAGDNFNSGKGVVSGGFSGGTSGGDGGYGSIPNAGALLPPGFSLGVLNDTVDVNVGGIVGTVTLPSIGAIIHAYKKDKDVNILSTPQILTTDNEEATIHVGKNVPFKTKSGTEVSSTDIFYETFEYKDVGITLKITPQISKDRMVRLAISQEVSRLESSVDFRPTTLKRTVDTTVIVNDKRTVVIGGLIDDSFSNIDYKTPCLGDIPLFGKAFSSSAKANEKTNLYIFLTPHVIQNPLEAEDVYKNKKEEIERVKEGTINLYEKTKEPPEGKSIP